ncbi:MAG: HD-GYP domain-containing protein [Elusimicrobiota bacterium]|jgi:putative nucleotidyltransferase with HDIG domain|nr:HD-GYP domain-containing protein [Elusimicrobiota bacterium]
MLNVFSLSVLSASLIAILAILTFIFLFKLRDLNESIKQNQGLKKNLDIFNFDIIQTLTKIIDAKDPYTGNHSVRVRQYSKLIAEKLKLPVVEIKKIEYAALMHDIGKIAVSETILRKDCDLSDEEMEIIKMHPIIGYNIAVSMTFFSDTAPLILYHHERYDGNGYPEKLSKNQIPIGARIICVADAYDAMVSDRPYRKSLPKENAILQLQKESGIQFDPIIVQAFAEILRLPNTLKDVS